MYKKIFVLIYIFCFSNVTVAQNNKKIEDAIKNTILTFFKGMQQKDTALIRTTLTSGMTMQTIQKK